MHRTVGVAVAALALLAAGCDGTGGAAPSTVLTDPASGANCAGRDVLVTRDRFSLVLEGDCGDIVVRGSDGSINVGSARSIRVAGSRVTVLNEKVGNIESTGADNIFNLTEAGRATIGDRTTVIGRTLDAVRFSGRDSSVNVDNTPAVDDAGSGNKVI